MPFGLELIEAKSKKNKQIYILFNSFDFELVKAYYNRENQES